MHTNLLLLCTISGTTMLMAILFSRLKAVNIPMLKHHFLRSSSFLLKAQTTLKATVIVMLMLLGTHAFAVTKTFNVASGNWNTAGNWSPSGVPLSGDDVIIPSARAVTVDVAAVCATLSFSATANSASSVTISGSNSLTVTGAITYVDPTGGNGDQTIAVGSGTLTCGSLVFANSSGGTEDNIFTVSTGIVNVNGNITFNGATNENSFTFSGAATLNITGTITGTGTFTVDVANATVNFNGASQNIGAYTFRNLTIGGTGDKTAVGAFNVNGILTINSGRTLNMSTFALGGTPTSTSGTGTLQTAATGSTPLPSGVTWTFPTISYNSGSSQTIVAGTYINLNGTGGNRTLINGGTINISGVFTPGSGTYTVTGNTMDFNGDTQSIPAFTYNSLTISGTGDKTAAGTINVNGVLTINASRILNMGTNLLGGNPTSTSGTGTLQTQNTANPAIPTGETWAPVVEFNGAAQTVEAGTYSGGIIVSGSGDKSGEAISVNGILTINSGRILNMGTNTLSGNPTTISGTGTLQTASTAGTPIPSGETWTGLVSYTSGSAQTIVAGNYIDLNGTGGNRTLVNGGTIGVSGVFTPGAGTYTVTGNTMDFNGGTQSIPALTYNSLTISGTGDKTATGTVNVNGVLTINSGRILSMGTNLLGGNPTSTSGTGTLQTQNTANPAIPTGETWAFTVEYNGAAQTVEAGTYSTGLTISGSGDKTVEAITINGVFTINSGRIANMGTNTLSGNPTSSSGTGTLQTASTANPAIPSGEIWTFVVEYNGAAQTIEAGTYNGGLTASGSGNKTGEAISVSGVFTINSGLTVNMGTNLLGGNPTSTSGTGTLQTQNTANPAIPSGETWTFTVEYNGAAQTVEAGTYTNLTCSGTGDKTGEAITVNGVLTINSGRTLNMGTNALSGTPTSTSGTGSLTTGNTSATPIPSDVVWTFGVTYNSASGQTIVAGTYPTLTASGGARTFSSTGVIIISGTFTPGAGNYTIGTSTVRYTTAAAGSVPVPTVASGGNYYNIEISSGERTLAATMIVANNMTINGGVFNQNNATSNTVTINGNLIVTSGIYDSNPASTGTSILNLLGNLTVSGTGVLENEGTAPNLDLRFVGTGTQTFSQVTPTNIRWVNFTVANGATLQLNTNLPLELETNTFRGVLTVQSGGTINMQGFTVQESDFDASTGTVTVDIQSGGNIITSNATGIQGSVPGTNTTKTYSSTANYEFRGAATGTFTTTPTANSVNNLTVNNASGVTLSQAFTVNGALAFTTGSLVVGNGLLTINGTLTGTTSFTGSTTSTINITGTGAIGSAINMNIASNTTRSLNNLTINRTSSTITLGNELRLIGTLTLSNGTLASAGNLRLVSDASGTARIATLAGTGAITGNVIAERFIPSSARRFRFMSSNITNGTIEDWRGEIFVTVPGTGNTVGTTNSNGFDATTNNATTVFHYNEPTSGSSSLGWTGATNTSNALVVGRGYRVFVRGDRSSLSRLTDTDPSQNAVTLNLVGPVNTGNIAMPVSYTNTLNVSNDGWNLLGNPYPSQFDWNSFWDAGNTGGDDGTNYTNIEAVISVFDASTNSYKSYNASSNTGTFNGILAQGQGFFSKSTGAGTAMTFTEAFKVSGTPTQMFKSATTSTDELHIKLIADSINIDEMIVKFIAGATKNADGFDIEKRVNPRANVASKVLNGVLLTVDARPEILDNDTIVVAIGTSVGNYTFEFDALPILPGKFFYLRDEFLNTTVALTLNMTVPFSVTSVPASYANDRFKIIVSGNAALPVSFANLWATPDDEDVTLNWVTYNEVNVSHFDLLSSTNGIDFSEVTKVKAQGAPNRTTKYTFVDTDNDLSIGRYYKVRIVDIDGAIDETNTVFVSKDNKITVADQLLCYPNPADAYTHISSEKIMAGDEVVINYLDASGKTNEITLNAMEDGVIKVNTAQLAAGLYFFVLSSNKETIGTANVLVQH